MRSSWLKRRVMVGLMPAAAIAIHLALAAGAPSIAHADDPLKVSGKLVGKIKDGEFKKSEDVSGLACAGDPGMYPRICLLVDDESQGAQVVILHKDHLVAGDFIPLINDSFKGKPLELDAEGVAYADGLFYVIGSHGRPRHGDPSEETMNATRAAATRHVFRIKFEAAAINLDTGKISTDPKIDDDHGKLAGLISGNASLAPFYDKALEDNGLTIEGVAARGLMLYAGLRAPVLDDGSALIVSAPISELFDSAQGQLTLDPVMLEKDTLGKPRGIRDLVAFGDGFLIIAGPAQDPDSSHKIARGDYAIYRKDGSRPQKMELEAYGTETKPEALLVMEKTDQALTGLILFDGPKEGEPRLVEIRTQ
ncbi:hypothetical protein QFZ27_001276 [Inquilinus ginsengisoli]